MINLILFGRVLVLRFGLVRPAFSQRLLVRRLTNTSLSNETFRFPIPDVSRTFPAKFALLQWDAYPAPVFILIFLLFKQFRAILIPYLESVGQGSSEYGIRIHYTALYRQWSALLAV